MQANQTVDIDQDVTEDIENLEPLEQDIPEEGPDAITEEIGNQARQDVLPKMTPLGMQTAREFYKYRFFGLFVNVGWISGFLKKSPEPDTVMLANSTLEHTNIRVAIPKKMGSNQALSSFDEPVSLTCRLLGKKVVSPITGEEEHTIEPHVIYARGASVVDMPLNDNFDRIPPDRIQASEEIKEEYNKWLEKALKSGVQHYKNRFRARANDGSMVILTGAVDSLEWRAAVEGGGGVSPKRARLKIMLRQTESDRILLPVHFYGQIAHQFFRLLERGNMLRIMGRIGTNVRPIMKDGEQNGFFTTHYIECLQPPMQARKDDIKLYPTWFVHLRNELFAKKVARKEENERAREERRRKAEEEAGDDDFDDDFDEDGESGAETSVEAEQERAMQALVQSEE